MPRGNIGASALLRPRCNHELSCPRNDREILTHRIRSTRIRFNEPVRIRHIESMAPRRPTAVAAVCAVVGRTLVLGPETAAQHDAAFAVAAETGTRDIDTHPFLASDTEPPDVEWGALLLFRLPLVLLRQYLAVLCVAAYWVEQRVEVWAEDFACGNGDGDGSCVAAARSLARYVTPSRASWFEVSIASARAVCRCILWSLGFRFRVSGLEHWQAARKHHHPFAIVSNHTSFLDAFSLAAAIGPFSAVCRADIADWTLVGAAARRWQCIFVNRG